jgi:hypothetical protein
MSLGMPVLRAEHITTLAGVYYGADTLVAVPAFALVLLKKLVTQNYSTEKLTYCGF